MAQGTADWILPAIWIQGSYLLTYKNRICAASEIQYGTRRMHEDDSVKQHSTVAASNKNHFINQKLIREVARTKQAADAYLTDSNESDYLPSVCYRTYTTISRLDASQT